MGTAFSVISVVHKMTSARAGAEDSSVSQAVITRNLARVLEDRGSEGERSQP